MHAYFKEILIFARAIITLLEVILKVELITNYET